MAQFHINQIFRVKFCALRSACGKVGFIVGMYSYSVSLFSIVSFICCQMWCLFSEFQLYLCRTSFFLSCLLLPGYHCGAVVLRFQNHLCAVRAVVVPPPPRWRGSGGGRGVLDFGNIGLRCRSKRILKKYGLGVDSNCMFQSTRLRHRFFWKHRNLQYGILSCGEFLWWKFFLQSPPNKSACAFGARDVSRYVRAQNR